MWRCWSARNASRLILVVVLATLGLAGSTPAAVAHGGQITVELTVDGAGTVQADARWVKDGERVTEYLPFTLAAMTADGESLGPVPVRMTETRGRYTAARPLPAGTWQVTVQRTGPVRAWGSATLTVDESMPGERPHRPQRPSSPGSDPDGADLGPTADRRRRPRGDSQVAAALGDRNDSYGGIGRNGESSGHCAARIVRTTRRAYSSGSAGSPAVSATPASPASSDRNACCWQAPSGVAAMYGGRAVAASRPACCSASRYRMSSAWPNSGPRPVVVRRAEARPVPRGSRGPGRSSAATRRRTGRRSRRAGRGCPRRCPARQATRGRPRRAARHRRPGGHRVRRHRGGVAQLDLRARARAAQRGSAAVRAVRAAGVPDGRAAAPAADPAGPEPDRRVPVGSRSRSRSPGCTACSCSSPTTCRWCSGTRR
jgi:hypothetical protein